MDLDSPNLWKTANKTFAEWITNLTYSLTELAASDEVFKLCSSICRAKPEFAELLFPYVIYDIILSQASIKKSKVCKNLSFNIQKYLLADTNKSKESIQLTLSTLNFLRRQFMKQRTGNRFWDTDFWSLIDLLDVARAAQQCSAFFTALLNVELWCEREFGVVSYYPIESLIL
jgi:ataxia telangiectasia mutated family protein